jgi:hypothetical protein
MVTPSVDYFFEINEMCQFLLMEEADPSFAFLGTFTEFSTENDLRSLFERYFPESVTVFSPNVFSEAS